MVDKTQVLGYAKRLGRIYVRVSSQEESELRQEAAEMGLNLSDYMRHILTTYKAIQAQNRVQG